MPTETVEYHFKLVYSSSVLTFQLNRQMTSADLISWANGSEIRDAFRIHPYYFIQVVSTESQTDGYPELAPAIVGLTDDKICEKFNPKYTSFYVRPVDPRTGNYVAHYTEAPLLPYTRH